MIAPRSPSPFRDELAGVQEQLRHLEAENRELRERVTRGHGRPRLLLLVPLTTAWALLMTASLVRMSARDPVHRATTQLFSSPPHDLAAGTASLCQAPAPFDGPALGF